MASEQLIIDSRTENANNVPLALMGGGSDVLMVESASFEPAPVQPVWAGSISTEGERVAHVKHGNRQVSVSLDVAGHPVAATNLVANPSFETDLSGWAAEGTVTIARQTGGFSGSWHLEVTNPGVALGVDTNASVAANTTYTASVYVNAPAGTPLRLLFQERTAALQNVGTTEVTAIGTGAYQRISATRPFGSTGQNARIIVRQDDTVARTVRVDAVQLIAATAAVPYFDGDSPGAVVSTFTNLVTNPSAETNATGWQNINTAGGTNPSVAYSGTVSFFTPSAAAGLVGMETTTAASPPVTAGLSYALSAYVYSNVTGGRVEVDWLNSTDAVISTAVGSTTTTGHAGTNGTFNRHSVIATAPTGAVKARLRVYTTTATAASQNSWFDAVLFEQSSTLGTYFDGSTPGATWNGTAHASTSTLKLTSVTTSIDNVLDDLNAKIAKIIRRGGTLTRITSTGRRRTYDLLSGTGIETSIDLLYVLGNVAKVRLVFTAAPYSRGETVTYGPFTETTSPALTFTVTDLPGDVPGLGRLVINETQGADQAVALWGLRSRRYSAATSAAVFYEAEACALLNATVIAGPTGASGGQVARHTSLTSSTTNWTNLIYVGPSSTAQTHVGGYRVFARAHVPATNTGIVSLRISWAGEHDPPSSFTTLGIDNPAVAFEGNAGKLEGWLLADLGTVNIPPATVGNQGWLGGLQARSTVAGDDIDIDYVLLVPFDEGYGQVASFVTDAAVEQKPVNASGSLEVRHDGVFVSRTGGYWPRAKPYQGDHLLVPPATDESRTCQVVAKFARGSTGLEASSPVAGRAYIDPAIDDISATLHVTPRYLA